jgi:hypothetical protein
MGDYYGTGQTAKIGKMRGMPDNFVIPVPKAKLKVPPKKLA